MPASEIAGRTKQGFMKLCEQVSPAAGREMTDKALLRHFDSESGKPSCVEDAAQLIFDRSYQEGRWRSLFPSLGQRKTIVEAMERRFPEQRAAIIQKADNACRGRFDFMGFQSLSFGDPVDWRLEPLSGKRTRLVHWSRVNYLDPSQAGDKKVTWELNRHQHFVTLGQAYWMTGDERYAAAFAGHLDSWMSSNPPGLGINWASSLELAIRMTAWIWSLSFFSGSPHLNPRLMVRTLKFLVAHARQLDRFMSVYFSPNTHLTGEALGLLYLGTALPELRLASHWRRRGTSILIEQLAKQVLPDGVYFERSTYYHRYTADFYTHFLLLIRGTSAPYEAQVRDALAAMLDHMMWMTRPDGQSPLIGDDDGGRLIGFGVTEPNSETESSVGDIHAAGEVDSCRREPNDFRDTLCTGAAMLGRSDWKYVAGDAGVETLWLLGTGGLEEYDAIQPMPPEGVDRGFQHGGFYIARDGWSNDSTVAIINSGTRAVESAAHAHSDATSFELAAAGRLWLVDPGSFTYTGSSKARDEFRSSLSHNVAMVDGAPCSQPDGPFRWERLARGEASQFNGGRALSYFRGSHDGYLRLPAPVECARQFGLIRPSRAEAGRPSYVVISDDFLSKGPHFYQASFIFDPSCSVAADAGRVVARHDDGARLDLFVHGSSAVHSHLKPAFVSRCYGERRRAPAVLFESAGTTLHQMVSVILPSRGSRGRTVDFISDHAGRWIEVSVDSPACRDVILIANSLRPPGSGCDRLNGSMALVRGRPGMLETVVLIDGDRFQADGVSILSSSVLEHCEVSVSGDSAEVRVQGTGKFEVEIRIAGQCFSLESTRRQPEEVVVRRFDLASAVVYSIRK